jgi:hypothetical protein
MQQRAQQQQQKRQGAQRMRAVFGHEEEGGDGQKDE